MKRTLLALFLLTACSTDNATTRDATAHLDSVRDAGPGDTRPSESTETRDTGSDAPAPDVGSDQGSDPLAPYWLEQNDPDPEPRNHRVLYLNFVGGVFAHGASSAAQNTTAVGVGSCDFVPPFRAEAYFSGRLGADRSRQSIIDEIVQKVRDFYSDVDLQIVTERPASKAFMMVTIGGTAADISYTDLPSALGVSGSPACEAADISPGATAFAFGETIAGEQTTRHPTHVALTIAHEAGHMLGLRHSSDEQSIMHAPHGTQWGSGVPVDTWCNRSIQDDLAVLTTNLGPHVDHPKLPAPSDAIGPEITASVAGEPRVLNVTVTDASAVRYIMMRAHVDFGDPAFNRPILLAEKVLFGPPYTFDLSSVSEDATIQILAVDRWDNLSIKTL